MLRIGRVDATAPADLAEVIDVNLTGSLNVARAAYPHLRASRGSLTVFASSSFTRGRPDYVAYSASKAAIVNLAQGLAEEWAEEGIRVNAVSPERTDTPMRRKPPSPTRSREGMLSTPEVARPRSGSSPPGLTGQVFDIKRHDSTPAERRPRTRTTSSSPPALPDQTAEPASSTCWRARVLRLVGLAATLLPIRTTGSSWPRPARPYLEGNLLALDTTPSGARRPDLQVTRLLEPYSTA